MPPLSRKKYPSSCGKKESMSPISILGIHFSSAPTFPPTHTTFKVFKANVKEKYLCYKCMLQFDIRQSGVDDVQNGKADDEDDDEDDDGDEDLFVV